MRLVIIIIFSILLTSCSWKKYSDDKYAIDSLHRNLIRAYRIGDTLIFKDNNEGTSSYLITGIDSTLLNKRGYFINGREYKDISILYWENSIDKSTNIQDDWMVLIAKYADNDTTFFDVKFKGFFSRDETLKLNKDTIFANNISFTNYYSFRPYNYQDLKDSKSIAKIYMTNEKGLIAYRYLNGEWWTRAN